MSAAVVGSLYAVVFNQGTVKVGMTAFDPERRFKVHRCTGDKFGIEVSHEIVVPFCTDDVQLRENVLCGYCSAVAPQACGFEWFKFPSADVAIEFLDSALAKIVANDFGAHGALRAAYLPNDRHDRAVHAIHLITSGLPPADAIKRVGLGMSDIQNKTEYRKWLSASRTKQ